VIRDRAFRRVVSASEQATGVSVCQESIVLNGPPGSLSGRVRLRNDSAEHLILRNLAVRTDKGAGLLGPEVSFRANLGPQSDVAESFSVSLSPTVPPGEYVEYLRIGAAEVPVRLVVQANVDVEVVPDDLYFLGIGPGVQHRAELLVINRGNVPVQVPNLRHSTVLDVDSICSNLSLAVREHGDEGSTATLDAFVRGIKRDMAGWVEIVVEEAYAIVDAGGTLPIHVTFTLPDDVDDKAEYDGAVRVFEELVTYRIVRLPAGRKAALRTLKAGNSKKAAGKNKKR
jgi:hypothetical protein